MSKKCRLFFPEQVKTTSQWPSRNCRKGLIATGWEIHLKSSKHLIPHWAERMYFIKTYEIRIRKQYHMAGFIVGKQSSMARRCSYKLVLIWLRHLAIFNRLGKLRWGDNYRWWNKFVVLLTSVVMILHILQKMNQKMKHVHTTNPCMLFLGIKSMQSASAVR